MRRRELRQCALQALYQVDVGKTDVDAAINHVFEEQPSAEESDRVYVVQLVHGTVASMEQLDDILVHHLEGWKIDRVARVDLSVLRLATYELLHETDVDVATIVDEAVELAKWFSTDESGRFVNGVLAKVLPVAVAQRNSAKPPDEL